MNEDIDPDPDRLEACLAALMGTDDEEVLARIEELLGIEGEPEAKPE